jgi:S-methylmethionine-dependent homocysteine/selenocysteine methylase
MCELRAEFETDKNPIVISGCLGPRGDGYAPGDGLDAATAQQYHAAQIDTFSASEADLVTAMTLTHAEEAVGIVHAAQAADIPVVISFTVETDGRLPTGQGLDEAIAKVDDASAGGPVYYMINCAHPTHFSGVLDPDAPWCARIRGIRLNASCLSHAELDEATELDDGDPAELGEQVGAIHEQFPWMTVVGGCCGTDQRHIRAIARHAG